MRVFIGDLNTLQIQKQEMPMLGGYLTVEDFTVGDIDRTIDGTLKHRDIAVKKRFMFDFIHILPDHFDTWKSQMRLLQWRELEYENENGSYSKYIVNFTDQINHNRDRTNTPWLYGQVSFIFEEV